VPASGLSERGPKKIVPRLNRHPPIFDLLTESGVDARPSIGEISMKKLTLVAVALIIVAIGGTALGAAMSAAGEPDPTMISMVGL